MYDNIARDTDSSFETESNLQTTNWQHVALTWQAGEAPSLYVDGTEVSYTASPSSTPSGATLAGLNSFIVGGAAKTGTWAGKIDESASTTRS